VSDPIDGDAARRLAEALRSAAQGELGPAPEGLSAPLDDVGRALAELFDRAAREVRGTRASALELVGALEALRSAQERTSAEAARQGAAVEAAGERLRLLSERAGEIANAAEVIDGIAAQTNLIALNAALEAARADREESRGFTLFAQEVRKLAERSGGAARDVVALIGQLQEEVTSTARVMDELRRSVGEGAQGSSWTAAELGEAVKRSRRIEEVLGRVRIADPRAVRAAEDLRRARDAIAGTLQELGEVDDGGEVARVLQDISSLLPRR